jgi:SNF2 family DNA or RNA helicase
MSHALANLTVETLSNVRWNTVVVDEAHAYKSSKSQLYTSLKRLAERARCVVLATATPTPNRVSEYFALLSILHPKTFTNFWSFSERYAGGYRDERTGWWKEGTETHVEELNLVLEHIQLSIPPPIELPPLIEETIEFDLPSSSAYDALVNEYERLSEILRTSHDRDELSKARYEQYKVGGEMRHLTARDKVPKVIDFVSKLSKETNTALYTFYADTAKLYHEAMPDALYCPGSISKTKRDALIPQMRTGKGKVGIFMIKSSGAGIEFQPATTQIVHADRDFTPSNVKQVNGRANRLGQTHPVHVYTMCAKNRYDTRLDGIHERKEKGLAKYGRKRSERVSSEDETHSQMKRVKHGT